MLKTTILAWLVLACTPLIWAQATSATGTPVEIKVTVSHHLSHEQPTLTKDDLIVTQRQKQLPVTDVISLRDDRAGLELFLLIDDSSNYMPSSMFEELRAFIASLPSTTAVGVAYIEDGRMQVAENPTQDRQRAVKLLRDSRGSKPASPFGALTEMIQGWRQGSSRRAVLLISPGINPGAADALQDPSAEGAVEAAQLAGITVYAIYHPGVDYLTDNISKIQSGQVMLAHVAAETGGEAYFLGMGPLPSLEPFLADIADHLTNQYLLEFLADPIDGPSRLQEVTVKSKILEVELIAPDKTWILGQRSRGPDVKNKSPNVSR